MDKSPDLITVRISPYPDNMSSYPGHPRIIRIFEVFLDHFVYAVLVTYALLMMKA